MRFGIREIANVVLRAKSTVTLGNRKFYKNEPIIYFDTLKTSSLEGASTTVYATGGRGNPRLIAWDGERTLTFTMEDALISPESFAILSGAGLVSATKAEPVYVHTTYDYEIVEPNTIVLPEEACWNKYDTNDDFYHTGADIFVMVMKNGRIVSEPCVPNNVDSDHKTITCYSHNGQLNVGDVVKVDFYVKRITGAQMMEIAVDQFGANYYLEAQALFRDEETGVDMPAEFIIPNCRVQSNFNFAMAATGDPSTFTFTMDAFPDYTKFKKTKKVLAALQVITEDVDSADDVREACTLVTGEAGNGVTLTFDDPNGSLIKVTAEGEKVDGMTPGESYDIDLFDDLTSKGNFVQAILNFNGLDATRSYTVIQENPAIQAAWPNGGTYLDGSVKTKEYTGAELAEGYAFLLGEQVGLITIKVKDAAGEVPYSVQITNRVQFRKKVTITFNDTDTKVDSNSYAVNEKAVANFDNVYAGDVICFKADTAITVKANGKKVTKDSTGIYAVTVKEDTTIDVT